MELPKNVAKKLPWLDNCMKNNIVEKHTNKGTRICLDEEDKKTIEEIESLSEGVKVVAIVTSLLRASASEVLELTSYLYVAPDDQPEIRGSAVQFPARAFDPQYKMQTDDYGAVGIIEERNRLRRVW